MTIVVLINHGFKVINKKEQNMINSESWSVYAHESEYSKDILNSSFQIIIFYLNKINMSLGH